MMPFLMTCFASSIRTQAPALMYVMYYVNVALNTMYKSFFPAGPLTFFPMARPVQKIRFDLLACA